MRRLTASAAAVLTLAGVLAFSAAPAAAVTPKTPPLSTPWTSQVSTTNPCRSIRARR
ncbi:hypothetical protein ACFQZ4_49095 [Catellatospora coxensis]